MSSDATCPKTKVTDKKLKTAIPDIYFKPEEMRAIDRKDQATVIRRSCTENRALVTVVMTNLDKVPEEGNAGFENVKSYDPKIKLDLNGEDD